MTNTTRSQEGAMHTFYPCPWFDGNAEEAAHYSLFPWGDAMAAELGEALQPYAVGKGTIRFPADEPIPLDLVARIVEIRLREVAAERSGGQAAPSS